VYVEASDPNWARVRILDGTLGGKRGWVPANTVAEVAAKTVCNDQELAELFAALRDATFQVNGADVPIPYRYPKDGCYARAEVMARLLAAAGYPPDKVFVVSTKGLRMSTAQGGDQADYGSPLEVNWWYHVAPVVYAQVQALAVKPLPVVLDPSVGSGPLTVTDWVRTTTALPLEEITYDDMRNRLTLSGAYPADRAWAVRAGAVVYSLPDANNPRATSTANPGDAASVLARTAALVPAHDVVAMLDGFFRACHHAMVDHNGRDQPVPYPAYGTDLARVGTAITALGPQLRAYILSTFPNFLTDWSLTFLSSGIEVGIKQLQAQLSA
jgi:hypothetical protein